MEVAWLKKAKAEASEAKTLAAVHAGLYPGLEPHTVQGSPVHRVQIFDHIACAGYFSKASVMPRDGVVIDDHIVVGSPADGEPQCVGCTDPPLEGDVAQRRRAIGFARLPQVTHRSLGRPRIHRGQQATANFERHEDTRRTSGREANLIELFCEATNFNEMVPALHRHRVALGSLQDQEGFSYCGKYSLIGSSGSELVLRCQLALRLRVWCNQSEFIKKVCPQLLSFVWTVTEALPQSFTALNSNLATS